MYRVMLVDDEYYFRQGLRCSTDWERYGFEVALEAKNGKEALELLRNERVDVLFLDINMPIMDGLELLSRLHEEKISPYTILLTGYAEFEYARQAMRHGAREYLLKPVDRRDMEEALKRLALRFNDEENDGRVVLDKPKSYEEVHALEKTVRELSAEALKSMATEREDVSPAVLLAEKVRLFIHENYDNPELSENDISRAVYVNTNHLCAVFKKVTGTTIMKYLGDYRMLQAKLLFDEGASVILDVSGRVGFKDANYFGRCFKKAYGVSPSQYLALSRSRE